MASFYSNENFPLQAVQELRRLGHDVLTSMEAGNANRSVPDEEVLAFATAQRRILLTHNRLHFLRLHRHASVPHAGIVICTFDPDFLRLGQRIHEQISLEAETSNRIFRTTRPR